jgi:hypothetical protein
MTSFVQRANQGKDLEMLVQGLNLLAETDNVIEQVVTRRTHTTMLIARSVQHPSPIPWATHPK